MLRSVTKLFEDKLGASDGEIGHVKDIYFDDQKWMVRYLVADTGSWMPGRLVLISPRAFGKLHQRGRALSVNLTRQQLENSPSIGLHKPVSRQYEEEYHRYYGWPFYWRGDRLWGMRSFPIAPAPVGSSPREQLTAKAGKKASGDPHLRSAKAIFGYRIQAADEVIGHLADFLMDDKDWAIRQMVVNIGHWLPGKRVLISPRQINRIDWAESNVRVDLTKEAIFDSPVFGPASFDIRAHQPNIFA